LAAELPIREVYFGEDKQMREGLRLAQSCVKVPLKLPRDSRQHGQVVSLYWRGAKKVLPVLSTAIDVQRATLDKAVEPRFVGVEDLISQKKYL
jgi:hypothetical protein